MKKNTEESKSYLMRALQNMPNDFTLSDARYHIRAALQKIEHVENKREKREKLYQQQQYQQQIVDSTVDPQKIIEKIDQMITDEKNKLESMKNKQKGSQDGFDDIQTIFG